MKVIVMELYSLLIQLLAYFPKMNLCISYGINELI
jgi:hypothetical protein